MYFVFRLAKIILVSLSVLLNSCGDDKGDKYGFCDGADARHIKDDGCSGPGYEIMLDIDVDEDKGTAEVEVLFIGESYDKNENVETRHGASAAGTRMVRGGDTPFCKRKSTITLTWVCGVDLSAKSASDEKEDKIQ